MTVMLIGGIVQAIIFGSVAVLIQTFDLGKSRLKEKLASMTEIIDLYKLPEGMAYRITDSIEYSWNLSQVLTQNCSITVWILQTTFPLKNNIHIVNTV